MNEYNAYFILKGGKNSSVHLKRYENSDWRLIPGRGRVLSSPLHSD
jgi:hypothetical protein